MDRRLLTILLIVFVQMLGAAMILPILPLFAQREFDISPQLIALLSTSFFAAQFIAGPFLGRLSDNYGRVPVLILSQIGTAVSFLMLALAPSAAFLFLARILDGITGGNIIVAQAYITDITPRRKRTEALGYIFAVFGLGFVIGPALGGVLSAALGPRLPYVIAAAAAIGVVFLTHFTLEESLTPEQRQKSRAASGNSIRPREIVRNRVLVLILLVAFLGQSGLGILQSTFALYGEAVLFKGYSPEAALLGVGLLLAAVGLGQFTTQAVLLRPLLAMFGEHRLIVIGNIFRMFAAFLFAVAATPWLGAVGSFVFAFGIGVMMPSLQSLATGTVDDEYRGGVLGIYQSTLSLSIIISSAIGGVLFAMSATMPYWVSAIVAAIALIPAIILLIQYGPKRPKTKPEVAAEADRSSDLH
jgi:DHA1 family tetracycline resistance protein-like MFS transporter